MTTIRIGRATDVATLGPLVADAERDGHRFVTRLVGEWQDGSNRFDRPGERLYVATVGDELAGAGGLNVDPYASDPAVGRVRHLYVAGRYRRRGVGSALLDTIVTGARGRFDRLRLRTRNPAADVFYVARGFERVHGEDACTHVVVLASREGVGGSVSALARRGAQTSPAGSSPLDRLPPRG